MSKKASSKTIPPRFYASADQYLLSTSNDFNKFNTDRTTPEAPRPSSPHSRAKVTPELSRKQSQPPSQRKYRQMPLTMTIEDSTHDENSKSVWRDADDAGSDDSERLAQYEHESLVKVVARLRDGNYIGSQSAPQVITTYSNSLNSSNNFNHSHPHVNDHNNSTTGNHGTPLNSDGNVNNQSPNSTRNKTFNNASNSNFNSSLDKYTSSNGTSNSTEANATFTTTPKATHPIDSRNGETSVLEASRRQMEAEIVESKRLLQQQLDIQRLYARSPTDRDRDSPSPSSPSRDRYKPPSQVDDLHTLYKSPQALVDDLLSKGTKVDHSTASPSDSNSSPEKVEGTQAKIRHLEDQLTAQRDVHAQALAELRETHAQAFVELRETHAQDQLALSRQVREERAERRRVEVKEEEARREADSRLAHTVREAGEKEKSLVKVVEEMKAEVKERDEALRDLHRVRAEAQKYQADAEEARGKLVELDLGRVRLVDERAKLEEEKKKIEEEKRRVEEQRRQYEKAGTDVLKVLNDANQKIIALEEHKWKLEDQCAELRGINERERKAAEQQRSKMEHEVELHKRETEQEAAGRQQDVRRMQAELEARDRERLGLGDELRKRNEQLKERERDIELLRNKLVEAEQRMLKMASQSDVMLHAHAKERDEWRKEREEWEREKEGLTGAVVDAQAEKNRLEHELDDNRRKFDSVKKLIG